MEAVEVWHNFKKDVHALLVSCPRGVDITPERLADDFKNLMGRPMPLFGHGTLSQLLQAMPDTVQLFSGPDGRILVRNLPNEETIHLSRLVNKSRISLSAQQKNRRSLRRSSSAQVPPNIVENLMRLVAQKPGICINKIEPAYQQRYGVSLIPAAYHFTSLVEMLENMESGKPPKLRIARRLNCDHEIYPTSAIKNLVDLDVKPSVSLSQTQQLPFALCQALVDAVRNHKNGVEVARFLERYQAFHGKPLPLYTYGYNDVRDFLAKSGGAVLVMKDACGHERVYAGGSQPFADLHLLSNEQHLKKTEHEEDEIERIRQVLRLHPQGLTTAQLEVEMQRLADRTIDWQALGGLASAADLANRFPNVLRARQIKGDSATLLSAVSTSSPAISLLRPGASVRLAPSQRLVASTLNLTLPADALGAGMSLHQQHVPLGGQSPLPVILLKVHSPSLFYLLLRGPECSNALDKLSDDIQLFVRQAGVLQRYALPTQLLRVQQLCLAYCAEEQEYFRALILDYTPESKEAMSTCRVFHLDFGRESVVITSELLAMPQVFAKLPAQAIRCALAHIMPLEDKFEAAAADLMNKLCAPRQDRLFIMPACSQQQSDALLPVQLLVAPDEDFDETRLLSPCNSLSYILVSRGLARYPDNDLHVLQKYTLGFD